MLLFTRAVTFWYFVTKKKRHESRKITNILLLLHSRGAFCVRGLSFNSRSRVFSPPISARLFLQPSPRKPPGDVASCCISSRCVAVGMRSSIRRDSAASPAAARAAPRYRPGCQTAPASTEERLGKKPVRSTGRGAEGPLERL